MGEPVLPEWAISLPTLNMPLNTTVTWVSVRGQPIDIARNTLAKEALRRKAEYLLFIDSDTVLPYFGIRKLLTTLKQGSEKAKVAGGIYATKCHPTEPVVYKENGGGAFWKWKQGEVFKVKGIGTGCMLIDCSVFQHLEEPWFKNVDRNPIGEERDDAVMLREVSTDDIYFCAKVIKAGFEILADGEVLCPHLDINTGQAWLLPDDSYPFQRDDHWARIHGQPEIDVARAMKIEGWMTPMELTWLGKQAKEHSNIVEVGSHLGRSTVILGQNTPGKVFAFDDWKGAREDPRWRPGLDFYPQFLENVKGLPVTPIRGDHGLINGTPELGQPDMIFIDGGHTYEEVKRDIVTWKAKLKPGGLLCGHDVVCIDVRRALDELIPNFEMVPNTSIWLAP
jgi:hypothetical protein